MINENPTYGWRITINALPKKYKKNDVAAIKLILEFFLLYANTPPTSIIIPINTVIIIPEIVKICKQIIIYQRSAGFVFPRDDFVTPTWLSIIFKWIPIVQDLYRYYLYYSYERLYWVLNKNTKAQKQFHSMQEQYFTHILQDEEIKKKVIPQGLIGTKRIMFNSDYYSSIQQKNVKIITDSIECINNEGKIVTKNDEEQVDCIILGTGFETQQYLNHFKYGIIGKNQLKLHGDVWKNDDFFAYLGKTIPQFPNFFMIMGPNTALGHNSMIIIIENDCNYILQCIEKMMIGNKTSIDPKMDICKKFNDAVQQKMKDMVWCDPNTKCWYRNTNGKVTCNWPWTTVYYWYYNRKVNFNDFNIE